MTTTPAKTTKATAATRRTLVTEEAPPLASFSQNLVFEKPTPGTVRFKATVFPADLDTQYLRKATLDKYVPGVDPESLRVKVTVEFYTD